MNVIELSEAENNLVSVISDPRQGAIVSTKHGKTVAVFIVPENDDDLERILLSRSRGLQRLLVESRVAVEGVSSEQESKSGLPPKNTVPVTQLVT